MDEINRLTGLGLSLLTAIDIKDGKLNETFEVERARENRKVLVWCKRKKNIPSALTAIWDCCPERLYLAFDGHSPRDHVTNDFVFIDADVADVDGKLTFAASRDKDPWHQNYKRKSCGIAYRWEHSLGVTPPLICHYKSMVHIVGGMHRFHLAKHYGTKRMPFLIEKTNITATLSLLPSAIKRETSH